MATPATEISTSPVAKHMKKSEFGFEPSYEKGWDTVIQLQALQKKTPHRYQQSPVFSRKVLSCPAENNERSHHHKHKHRHRRRHLTDSHRRRGNSEGDKKEVTGEERVHLLSSLPWRKSTDDSGSDNSSNCSSEDIAIRDLSPLRRNVGGFPPSLPHRLDTRLNLERERTRSVSATSSPLFLRRGKQRARSQGSSPIPDRKLGPGNPPMTLSFPSLLYANPGIPPVQYKATVIVGAQKMPDSSPGHVLSPIEDPVTPQAGTREFIPVPTLHVTSEQFEENNNHYVPHEGAKYNSNEFLQVPPLDGVEQQFPSSSPHTLRKFLGLETGINPTHGLTENEILQSRLLSRRSSSSSDSSTSTLT